MSSDSVPEPTATHTYFVRDEEVVQFVLPGWERFLPEVEEADEESE